MAIGYNAEPAILLEALKARDLAPRPRKPLSEFVFGNIKHRSVHIRHKFRNGFCIKPVRADDIINTEFRMALLQFLQFFAVWKIAVSVGVKKLDIQRFLVAIQIEQNGTERRDANASGNEYKLFPPVIQDEITALFEGFDDIPWLEFFQRLFERTSLRCGTGRQHHLLFMGC